MHFINDCARTQFTYVIIGNAKKLSTISRCKQNANFCVKFWRRETQTNWLHCRSRKSIDRSRAKSSTYRKVEGGESSDKVLSGRTTIKWVIQQLISKFLCSLSVRVTRSSSNAMLGTAATRKLSFCLYMYAITYRLFTLADTDAEDCNTYRHLQTDSGMFAFHVCGPWSRNQESYSRRHKNGDVSVPFRSVETPVLQLPFYHLYTAVIFPSRFRSVRARSSRSPSRDRANQL